MKTSERTPFPLLTKNRFSQLTALQKAVMALREAVIPLVPCSVLVDAPPLLQLPPFLLSLVQPFAHTISWSPQALASFPTHLLCPSWICFPGQSAHLEGRERKGCHVCLGSPNVWCPAAFQQGKQISHRPGGGSVSGSSFTRGSLPTTSEKLLDRRLTAHHSYYPPSRIALARFYHKRAL